MVYFHCSVPLWINDAVDVLYIARCMRLIPESVLYSRVSRPVKEQAPAMYILS